MSQWDVRWPVVAALVTAWPLPAAIETRLPAAPVIDTVWQGGPLDNGGEGETVTATVVSAYRGVTSLAFGWSDVAAVSEQYRGGIGQVVSGQMPIPGTADHDVATVHQSAVSDVSAVGYAANTVGRISSIISADIGTAPDDTIYASAAQTLGAIASQATGQAGVAAMASHAVSGQRQFAQGVSDIMARAVNVLSGVSQSVVGVPLNSGSFAQSVASTPSIGTGSASIDAMAAHAIGGISQALSSQIGIAGSSSQSVRGLMQSVSAQAIVMGAASQTSGGISQALIASVGATAAPGDYIAATPFQSGTTSCTVNFSATGRTAGDLLIIQIETANQAVTAPGGWYQLNQSPQGTGTAAAAGAVRKTLFGKKSTGTETTVVISCSSGNHVTAMGHVFRGVDASAQQNLIKNSANMTSADWAVYDDNNVGAAIATSAYTDPDGNAAFKLSWGATDNQSLAIYPNDSTVCTPNTTYRTQIWAQSETGTVKFAFDAYDGSDHLSADFTVTTAGDYCYFDYTTGSSTSLKYSQLWQITCASDGSAASLIVGKPQISVIPDAEYVRTTTAPVTNFKGVNASAGGTQASNATFTCPGPTTTVDNTLVAVFIANDRDLASTTNLSSPTNANLTSVTLRADQTVATGVGGGIGLITGIKAVAGAVGNTTVTNAVANTSASITLALAPAA